MIVKGSQSVERYNRSTATAARLNTVKAFATVTLPLALTGLFNSAFAQEADAASQLTTTAKTGMTALGGLIVGILLVGIGITVLWFANRHTKQAVAKS